MDYQSALKYLYDNIPMFHRIGPAAFKADLSNSLALSAFLGQPEKNFKSIHIAGTNGKGSSAHMLAAILQEAGYNVGLYTSPHYKDFRERIKINGEYISENEVVDFVEKIKLFVNEYQPSFFELTVGMAFEHFNRHKVDIAVVEVGMGGRLDATNIIEPECSLITNIGFDHDQFLGNTLAKIAMEKAGIIKNNIPTVIGEFNEETRPVFETIAKERASELYFCQDIYNCEQLDNDGIISNFNIYRNKELIFENIQLDLCGPYQEKNLSAVLSTVDVLSKMGYNLTKDIIYKALASVRSLTKIIGRWDILQKENPMIIADSAHNSHGLAYVKKALKNIAYHKLHIVFGMVSDKEPQKLLTELPADAEYYFCKADLPRALDAQMLKDAAENLGLSGEAYFSVKNAYESAKTNASDKDLILVLGSIFVVAEVL
jgi:dihydrofolate synthase / folylpolyglutamate synthase